MGAREAKPGSSSNLGNLAGIWRSLFEKNIEKAKPLVGPRGEALGSSGNLGILVGIWRSLLLKCEALGGGQGSEAPDALEIYAFW